MRPYFIACILSVLTLGLLPAQTQVHRSVYFETGKSELTESALVRLDSLIDHETLQVIRGVAVQGHTDAVGSDAANDALSRERALAVARYLRDHGIRARAVKLRAHGEERPVASNATSSGRARNRRVELTVYLGEMKPAPLVEAEPEEIPFPEEVAGNEAEYICSQPLTMTGRRGASLYFPPEAFDSCGATLEIRFTEFHRFADIANKDVSTMADDTILESAGMICVSAFLDGQRLRDLREGKTVEVRIPAERYDPEMGLYLAPNTSNRRAIDWTRNPNSMPTFDVETNTYVFQISELGCVNLDKPAEDTTRAMVAVRVRKRMLRQHNLYVQYGDRGTCSQGKLVRGPEKIFRKHYYVFGTAGETESLHLKGYFWTRNQRYGVDKRLQRGDWNEKSVELGRKKYQLVARISPRSINGTDRFRGGRSVLGTVLPAIR